MLTFHSMKEDTMFKEILAIGIRKIMSLRGKEGVKGFLGFLFRENEGTLPGMMQDTEAIQLVKPVPSDRLATQVLVMWYNTVRPKWKKPLDLGITVFFILMTLYSFSMRPLPLFAWFSLAGALMAIILSWFYVPFLAKAALTANKKSAMYHQEKNYVFHEDHMIFSSKDIEPLNIPYDRFTTLCKTRRALLFLFGKKLVLWLPLDLMSVEQLESIVRRFRNHGVEVRDIS